MGIKYDWTLWLLILLFIMGIILIEYNTGFIILLTGLFVKLYREVGEMKVGIKHSFTKIKEDMDLIKKKLRIS